MEKNNVKYCFTYIEEKCYNRNRREALKINFSENLKKHRKRHKFTQGEMVDKLGIKRPTYGAYERNEIHPPYDKIMMMAGIFDVPAGELLGGADASPDVHPDIRKLIEKSKNNPTFRGVPLDERSKTLLCATLDYLMDLLSASSTK